MAPGNADEWLGQEILRAAGDPGALGVFRYHWDPLSLSHLGILLHVWDPFSRLGFSFMPATPSTPISGPNHSCTQHEELDTHAH